MFIINGIEWNIVFTNAYSDDLKRSDGSITVGMTDFNTKCVYLSKLLKGAFLRKVLAHELCHCFCFSYDISMPIEQEEFMADWISTYGTELVYLLDDLMQAMKKAHTNVG
jgi:hypothetical protein